MLLADTRFKHDEFGRVYQSDASLFVSQGFNPSRAASLSDGNSDGLVTAFAEFDKLSRLTFATEDDGQTSEVIYDGVSRAIESIDAIGNRQMIDYDQNSNATSVTSVELPSQSGAAMSLATETFVTSYVYDQFNRVVRATDNLGQTARFQYDSRDLLVSRSDAEGGLTNDPLNKFPQPNQSTPATQINTAGLARMLCLRRL